MTPELRIDRLAVRATVTSDDVAWRGRLVDLASHRLRTALDRAWSAAAAELGLDPTAEILVRRVKVRIHVDETADDEAIAVAWARAIVAGLGAVGKRAPLSVLGVSDEVAVFADRATLELRYVEARAHGESTAWWWSPAFERRDPPPPEQILLDWAERAPAEAAARIVELVLRGAPIERMCDAPAAVAIARRIAHGRFAAHVTSTGIATRSARLAAAPDGTMPEARSDSLPGPIPRDAVAAAATARLWGRLPPAVREALTTAATPHATLLALCAAAVFRPSDVDPSAADIAGWVAYARERRHTDPTRLPPRDEPGTDRPSDPPEPQPSPTSPPQTASWLSRRERHEVNCGGLLFLLRDALAAAAAEADPESVLLDVAVEALLRVTAPFPAPMRRSVMLRETPLVRVFCGTDELPERLDAHPPGEAAQRIVDRIEARLPRDLTLEPIPDAHPHRALAAAVQRSGVLLVDRTHAELYLPLRSVDLALRLGGLDLDPGFCPAIGRVVRFFYVEQLP